MPIYHQSAQNRQKMDPGSASYPARSFHKKDYLSVPVPGRLTKTLKINEN